MIPRVIIEEFNHWLEQRHIEMEAVIIGGSALALLGVIDRHTRDVDVLTPSLPAQVLKESVAFARNMTAKGEVLSDDWLNNGPTQLAGVLPTGWEKRTRHIYQGSAMVLKTLGPDDLLKTKLFALCDRGTDWGDCLALQPSQAQIEHAIPWLAQQDAHPQWPEHVQRTMTALKKRLGYVV